MRKLILLRGAQGTGKSTLIKDYRPLVVSFDDFREIYSTHVPTLDGDASLVLSSSAQKKVVRAAFEATEERMRLGATVIIDNMNLRERDQKDWVGLAKKYGYEILLIDVQGDVCDEELLERNRGRGHKRVPEDVLLDCAAAGREHNIHPAIREIDRRQLREEIEGHTEWKDFSDYEQVVIIGDVQSCGDALNQAVVDPALGDLGNESTAWIFIGDLFDRGPDAGQVFELVHGAGDNVVFIEGNHETNMRQIITGTAGKGQFKDARISREQIHAAGYTDADILALLDRTRPLIRFSFGGKHFFACHGGVDGVTAGAGRELHLLPDYFFINGVSDRAETYKRRTTWSHVGENLASDNPANEVIQLHGHRNGGFDDDRLPADAVEGVYNLEGGVEHGAELRFVTIDRLGEVTVHGYCDRHVVIDRGLQVPMARPDSKHISEDIRVNLGRNVLKGVTYTISEELAAHPDIRTKDIGNGITSYNFTRDAFYKGRWDQLSTSARGLFMRGEKVVARGSNKFFNLNESCGYTTEQVLTQFEYPVLVRPKINGFLLIIASVDGELVYYTKSGPTDYAKAGQEEFEKQFDAEQRRVLERILHHHDVSLTCEAVLTNDPHIVADDTGIYVLDAIVNDAQFRLAEPGVISEVTDLLGLDAEVGSLLAHDRAELDFELKRSENSPTEGAVFTDAAGRWTKVKSNRYSYLKSLRTPLMRVVTGQSETLGQQRADEEAQLRAAGVWDRLPDYLVETPTGQMALRIPDIAKDAAL